MRIGFIEPEFFGPDPSDFLFPVLLVVGIVLGYLDIKDFKFPLFLKILIYGFILFYGISNIIGNPVYRILLHLASNVALFCFLKLYVVSPQRMRRVLFAILFRICRQFTIALAEILRNYGVLQIQFSFQYIRQRAGDLCHL